MEGGDADGRELTRKMAKRLERARAKKEAGTGTTLSVAAGR